MSGHDDVRDLEVVDGVVDDALGTHVVRGEDVGDVAVHEDVAWLGVQQGCLWAAGVGAAEPEEGGRLPFGAAGEEVRVFLGGFGGEGFVLREEGVEGVCCCGGVSGGGLERERGGGIEGEEMERGNRGGFGYGMEVGS